MGSRKLLAFVPIITHTNFYYRLLFRNPQAFFPKIFQKFLKIFIFPFQATSDQTNVTNSTSQNNSAQNNSTGQNNPSQTSPMLGGWGSNTPGSNPGSGGQVSPWGSASGGSTKQSPLQSQQQTGGQWGSGGGQQYGASPIMPPPPHSSQSTPQFNHAQFNFGANASYDPFTSSQQRSSLPSPNMNHQFLGLNGNPTSSKFCFIICRED